MAELNTRNRPVPKPQEIFQAPMKPYANTATQPAAMNVLRMRPQDLFAPSPVETEERPAHVEEDDLPQEATQEKKAAFVEVALKKETRPEEVAPKKETRPEEEREVPAPLVEVAPEREVPAPLVEVAPE